MPITAPNRVWLKAPIQLRDIELRECHGRDDMEIDQIDDEAQ
jgi:hypothetical protein